MGNVKARSMMERVGLGAAPFENPEVSAMSEICEILRNLPDDASRLRVMHWSFGRFNPEFKRPLAWDATLAAVPVAAAPVAAEPIAATEPTVTDMKSEIAAVAPEIVAPAPPKLREVRDFTDFGRQLSELGDLFPPDRRQQQTSTEPPLNIDAF